MKPLPSISLRTSLGLLLALATLLTFAAVATLILLYRLPQIEDDLRRRCQADAVHVAVLIENQLQGLEEQLRLITRLSSSLSPEDLQRLVDALAGEGGTFRSVSLIGDDDKVAVLGLPEEKRSLRSQLLHLDMSANRLYQMARALPGPRQTEPIWSDAYLSVLSGETLVGVAMRTGEKVVIAELARERLLQLLRSSFENNESQMGIVDGRGRLLATTDRTMLPEIRNMDFGAFETYKSLLAGGPPPERERHMGREFLTGGLVSKKLGWAIAAHAPAGMGNDRYRTTVWLVVGAFVGALVISLMLAPFWAARIILPVNALIRRAHQIASGAYPTQESSGSWIIELNQLTMDLDRMIKAIQARELEMMRSEERLLATLDNAHAVAIQWYDLRGEIVYWNSGSTQIYGFSADEAVGQSIAEQPLMYLDQAQTDGFLKLLEQIKESGKPAGPAEFPLRHKDGRELFVLATVFMIPGEGGQPMFVCMDVDITDLRRAEREVRQLNVELEQRVMLRTEQLEQANRELAEMLESLQRAQQELIQSEKLAALGKLVAGLAHELNTPIGNGLMAVSTLTSHLKEFQQKANGAMRRSDLTGFTAQVETACEIAERNLSRAADMVTSFKQVAVDQTSDRRRQFDVAEVVHEIVVTLQPTLKRSPFQLITETPLNLIVDSYPGALGQALTNLINNAVTHAFDGRDHGVIRIEAVEAPDGRVRITVGDDGCGIPPESLSRIFDPFFTTRMGRGGTGLGLHIAYNAVTRLMGGRIEVSSRIGEGARFDILIPRKAPDQESNEGS